MLFGEPALGGAIEVTGRGTERTGDMRCAKVLAGIGVVCAGLGLVLAGGCASGGGVEAEAVVASPYSSETARWVAAAGTQFARQRRHTRYAIVPSQTHDLMILEQNLVEGGRVTWLVEVPLGARGVVVVDENEDARGWVVEQPAGEEAHVAPVRGELVIDQSGEDLLITTTRLNAIRRAPRAGEAISPSHSVFGEYGFMRMELASVR